MINFIIELANIIGGVIHLIIAFLFGFLFMHIIANGVYHKTSRSNACYCKLRNEVKKESIL